MESREYISQHFSSRETTGARGRGEGRRYVGGGDGGGGRWGDGGGGEGEMEGEGRGGEETGKEGRKGVVGKVSIHLTSKN